MTTEEQPTLPSRRIISEPRGRYTILDEQKLYDFGFPITNSIENNLDIVSYLKLELEAALEAQKKKQAEEDKKKCECASITE